MIMRMFGFATTFDGSTKKISVSSATAGKPDRAAHTRPMRSPAARCLEVPMMEFLEFLGRVAFLAADRFIER
jgi:hypothetical protein